MEKWNEISYNLSEKLNLSEDKFELIVIQILGVLGWKKYTGDLEIQPVFKTYNRKSKRMDILVKSENQNLFVIEVKKPSLPIIEDHIYQLKEYMRFLKLEFGLLFGEKIQVYYDGNKFRNKDFILLDEIEYKSDNLKGLDFVELFDKSKFNETNLTNYIKNKLSEIQNIELIKKLKTELQTKEISIKIKELLKTELNKKYNEIVLDNVFKNLKIKIENNIKGNENIEVVNKKSVTKTNPTERIKKKDALSKINIYLNNNNQPEILNRDTIYSNKNSANDKWWFEPNPNMFKQNFNLVLNDYNTKKLFLFEIPKNDFNPIDTYFYYRNEVNRYSIRIEGNDTKDFKDELGKLNNVKFIKYLKHTIKYK